MNNLKRIALIFFLIINSNAFADNVLEIIIDKGIENTLPIAIIPFVWSQTMDLPPINIATVISNDLARSGRFAPM